MTIGKSHLPRVNSGRCSIARYSVFRRSKPLNLRLPLVTRPLFLKRDRFFSSFALFAVATACLFGSGMRESKAIEPTTPAASVLAGQKYELKLHHLHTGEDLDVVYRIGDTYIPSAMAQLNHFLRDHRTQDASHYDPKEFDLLHSLMDKLGKNGSVIDVVCGYRTPWSNNFLRTRGGTAAPAVTGVAEHSQHMLAKAIDIRVPGVSTAKLRDTALSLHDGGVGYYPVSQFVHVDVGPVRQWTFGGRGSD
jgi:uncharacterized protein YcbK (DUF882 family)